MTSTHNYCRHLNRQHLQPYSYPYPTAADYDESQEPPSLSSSPASQYSVIPTMAHAGGSQAPAVGTTFPRRGETNADRSRSYLSASAELMSPGNGNQTAFQSDPRQGRRTNHNHERGDSLSSLGSAGPTSPFNSPFTNPRIAVADAGSDSLYSLHEASQDPLLDNNYVTFGKAPVGHGDASFGLSEEDNLNHQILHNTPYPIQFGVSARRNVDRGGFAPTGGEYTSIPRHGVESVASSTIGGDSPATPGLRESFEDDRRNAVPHGEPPRLARTMTDTYTDTAYIPNLNVTSPPSQQHFSPSAPFSRAIEAANMQHLHVDQSHPSFGFRNSSPFRNGSPLAPSTSHDFVAMSQFAGGPPRAESDRRDDSPSAVGHIATPQTISPKDSVLEFEEDEGNETHTTLFPTPHRRASFGSRGHLIPDGKTCIPPSNEDNASLTNEQGVGSMRMAPTLSFTVPHEVTSAVKKLIAPAPSSHEANAPSAGNFVLDEGGTYSCTYHGCDRRFDSQKDLQAHKREGHRSAGAGRRGEKGLQQQTQQGPHTCMRLNPSTGKVCGSKFSRPYDLTRHEDTIHNARKRKVKCDVCRDEKMFSRRDALSRHFKVCHEDLFEERFGKARRRQA